jgi:hypothetical protein
MNETHLAIELEKLKSFRKSYDELVRLKGSEDNADKFLELMTHVVYDRR